MAIIIFLMLLKLKNMDVDTFRIKWLAYVALDVSLKTERFIF